MTCKNSAGVEFKHALWPNDVALGVMVLVGPVKSGKSHFVAETAIPGKHKALVFDTHQGFNALRARYSALTIVDLMAETAEVDEPAKKWKIFDNLVKEIKPGQYDVIAIDVATEIEAWMAEYCKSVPSYIGGVKQSATAPGLFWGAYKAKYQEWVLKLASKCQTLIVATHVGLVYKDNQPTNQLKMKGKDSLNVASSLTLWLHRQPQVPRALGSENLLTPHYPIPAADVMFSRLAHLDGEVDNEFGEFPSRQTLPDYMEQCRASDIRRCIVNPPTVVAVETGAQHRQVEMTPDDRLILATRTAEANATTATAQLERAELRMATGTNSRYWNMVAPALAKSFGMDANEFKAAVHATGLEFSSTNREGITKIIQQQLAAAASSINE